MPRARVRNNNNNKKTIAKTKPEKKTSKEKFLWFECGHMRATSFEIEKTTFNDIVLAIMANEIIYASTN